MGLGCASSPGLGRSCTERRPHVQQPVTRPAAHRAEPAGCRPSHATPSRCGRSRWPAVSRGVDWAKPAAHPGEQVFDAGGHRAARARCPIHVEEGEHGPGGEVGGSVRTRMAFHELVDALHQDPGYLDAVAERRQREHHVLRGRVGRGEGHWPGAVRAAGPLERGGCSGGTFSRLVKAIVEPWRTGPGAGDYRFGYRREKARREARCPRCISWGGV